MTELLHDLLDTAAARDPDGQALTCQQTELSWAELAEASRRLAARLHTRGVRRGDRVVIVAPNHAVTATLAYACSRLGAVFVILHEQVRGSGLAHVLADAEPVLLVTDTPAIRWEAAELGIAVLDLAGAAAAELDEAEAAALARGPQRPLAVDPVCLIYTSGSTGLPKAVVSTHAQVVFAARAIQSQLQYRAEDTVYIALPLSFDYGLYQLFLGALSGAHCWLSTSAEIGPTLLRNLRHSGATVLPAVPSLAENLARMLARYGGELRLRLVTNTGAAMQPGTLARLREQVPGLRVQLMFGLTECKRVSIMPPDEDLRRPGACGRPLPGTEVLVLGDDGSPLPAGEIGELVVRGPHVMSGYWRRPELSAQRFPRRDGLFPQLHSGDYGWLDEDGYLYFSGRRDDLYKAHGFRVSATEVEAAVCRLPGVESAAVLPPTADRPDPRLFVVAKLSAAEVLELLRADLEPYKVPQRCTVVEQMPLTGNGKIDRKALATAHG
ncbi:AMP-dependent synthetase and ligase [Catellatospora sp. TT07R-123]|uniref:class I adenylate-forming enzyme family protein n=1 Tax=Catellatospora sp. TT07R-123 TaxID=2733863 RepID=UPI001B235B83|nr:AMP-binding protein [Catellatospora sp. TT07R-123]GHJ48866.1 AMP-dependent synthetase and ligase [Catellatospora sp. TT07R-123]